MPKKEDHEAEINRKIEEIRNRNKEIARRHQVEPLSINSVNKTTK